MGEGKRSPGGSRRKAQEAGPKGRARRESGRERQRRQQEAADAETPLYRLKVEAAQALGVWDKVQAEGWGALSAAESGRVGGYVTRCLRLAREEQRAAHDGPGG